MRTSWVFGFGCGLAMALAAQPAAAVSQLSTESFTPSISAAATNYTGDGFDACAAPSSAAMSAWTAGSSYRAIGVYIGGPTRLCAQPNLTASWLTTQAGRGWHFMPIYAGRQAHSLPVGSAALGKSQADSAVGAATSLGIPTGSLIYDDMETYATTYRARVLAYLSAWTAELHAKGYKSGVYSSSASGIAGLNSNYGSGSPDVVFFAHWNNERVITDSFITAGH